MTIPRSVSAARNRHRQCDATGCTKTRRGLTRWCILHGKKTTAYGTPDGRPVPKDLLGGFERAVSDIFAARPNHPAIEAAEAEIERAIWRGRWESPLTDREMKRLQAGNVVPREVLLKVSAVALLFAFHPTERGFTSDRAQTFGLARALLKAAPATRIRAVATGRLRYAVFPATAMHELGTWLRITFSPFVRNLINTVSADVERQATMAKALASPL